MSKTDDNLKAYQKAINNIEDYFEYANESESDRRFIHKQLNALTEELKRINKPPIDFMPAYEIRNELKNVYGLGYAEVAYWDLSVLQNKLKELREFQ